MCASGIVNDLQQRLLAVAGQRRDLPLAEQAQRESLFSDSLAGRGLEAARSSVPFLHRVALTILSPDKAIRRAIALHLHADGRFRPQPAFVTARLGDLVEAAEGLPGFRGGRQLLLAPIGQAHGMHDGRFACSTPTDQGIEVRVEQQAGRLLAAPHVARVADFNRLDEMLGRVERRKTTALVATLYRDLLPIQQRKPQAFQTGLGHLDPGVTRTWNSYPLEAVAIAAHHAGKAQF